MENEVLKGLTLIETLDKMPDVRERGKLYFSSPEDSRVYVYGDPSISASDDLSNSVSASDSFPGLTFLPTSLPTFSSTPIGTTGSTGDTTYIPIHPDSTSISSSWGDIGPYTIPDTGRHTITGSDTWIATDGLDDIVEKKIKDVLASGKTPEHIIPHIMRATEEGLRRDIEMDTVIIDEAVAVSQGVRHADLICGLRVKYAREGALPLGSAFVVLKEKKKAEAKEDRDEDIEAKEDKSIKVSVKTALGRIWLAIDKIIEVQIDEMAGKDDSPTMMIRMISGDVLITHDPESIERIRGIVATI